MVQVVLGVAVFVLAVAVVGLFAMIGELAARVPDPDQPAGAVGGPGSLQPLPGARLGAEPAAWPPALFEVRDAALAHVIVFGSSCATCGQIASGETGPLDVIPRPLAVVISCARPEAGDEFLVRYPMVTGYPHVLDVRGEWLISNFEVGVSPTVLVFGHGRLISAHTFTAATVLQELPLPGQDGDQDSEREEHVHSEKTA
jgi:hypothetical protein